MSNENDWLSSEVIEYELCQADPGSASEQYWVRELQKVDPMLAEEYQNAIQNSVKDIIKDQSLGYIPE